MPRLRLTVLGLVTLGLLVGTPSAFAHATDPPELLGNTTVVHACVSSRGGMVQVVDATTGVCQFGATALHWGLVGTPGSPGTPATSAAVVTGRTCGPLILRRRRAHGMVVYPGTCTLGALGVPVPFNGLLDSIVARVPGVLPSGVTLSVEVELDGGSTGASCVIEDSDHCGTFLIGLPVPAHALLSLLVFVDNQGPSPVTIPEVVFSLGLTPSAAENP